MYVCRHSPWKRHCTKNRFFFIAVLSETKSTLLYVYECWTITKADEKLRVFHLKCLRRILKIFTPR